MDFSESVLCLLCGSFRSYKWFSTVVIQSPYPYQQIAFGCYYRFHAWCQLLRRYTSHSQCLDQPFQEPTVQLRTTLFRFRVTVPRFSGKSRRKDFLTISGIAATTENWFRRKSLTHQQRNVQLASHQWYSILSCSCSKSIWIQQAYI